MVSVGATACDQHGSRVQDKAELFFSLFDLFLRQLALRELMNTADNATGMATGVTNGFGTQPNPRDRAIRPNDSAFEILQRFSIDYALRGFLNVLALIGMDPFQPGPRIFVKWYGANINIVQTLDRAAPDRFIGTINEKNFAEIRIVEQEDLPQKVRDLAESFAGLKLRSLKIVQGLIES